jgi:predicted nucleic acid-binding protein
MRASELISIGIVLVRALPDTSTLPDAIAGKLQVGERLSLALTLQLGQATLLTDGLAARKAAERLRLTPTGSLGVVVSAAASAVISVAEALVVLEQPRTVRSLHVSPDSYRIAGQAARGIET